jgi:Flp pilus assembly protein TadD
MADDYPGAVAFGRQAVAAAPDDPVARDVLGLGLAFELRWPEATAELQRAIQLDPSNAQFREHLANVEARRRLPPAVPSLDQPKTPPRIDRATNRPARR